MRETEAFPAILLVEDNDRDIELLRERFKGARLMNPLRVVRDGTAAARYLAGLGRYQNRAVYPPPGMVLLDLMLPKMDGFEVLAWIRARPEFNGLCVIVLTAYASDPLIERARACGANGYLIKGEGTEDLLRLLRGGDLGWALLPARKAA